MYNIYSNYLKFTADYKYIRYMQKNIIQILTHIGLHLNMRKIRGFSLNFVKI